MPESLVQVTSGAGPKLHTWQRTVGANNVEDEFVVPGEYPLPSYIASGSSSVATANDHLLTLMAGASLNVRVRRIRVMQAGLATAAAFAFFELWRLSTAGTGGTAITPRPLDTTDAAAGATSMTLPTAKGTESLLLMRARKLFGQATTLAGTDVWEWTALPGQKPLIIPAGTTNGIAVKSTAAIAAGSAIVEFEFVETAFAG